MISLSAFIAGYIVLNETVPCRTRTPTSRWRGETQYARVNTEEDPMDTGASVALNEQTPFVPAPKPSSPSLRSLLTSRVLLVILNFSFLGIEVAFYVLRPLVFSTPIEHGGLGMSPSVIGTCIAAFGLSRGIVSAFFFAPLVKKMGIRCLLNIFMVTFIGFYALFPLMNAIARTEGQLTPMVWVVFILQLSLATLPSMSSPCIFMYLNAASPGNSALGATNGLAQTIAAIMRTLCPAGVTSLFALSIQRDLLGSTFVYVVMCSLAAVATMATLLLPAKPWDRAD